MNVDGSCPACGRVLVEPAAEADVPRAPWHFKLLVAAVIVYLAWRVIQMVGWIVT